MKKYYLPIGLVLFSLGLSNIATANDQDTLNTDFKSQAVEENDPTFAVGVSNLLFNGIDFQVKVAPNIAVMLNGGYLPPIGLPEEILQVDLRQTAGDISLASLNVGARLYQKKALLAGYYVEGQVGITGYRTGLEFSAPGQKYVSRSLKTNVSIIVGQRWLTGSFYWDLGFGVTGYALSTKSTDSLGNKTTYGNTITTLFGMGFNF